MGYPIFGPQVRWGTLFLVDFWIQFGANLALSWATLVHELVLDGLVVYAKCTTLIVVECIMFYHAELYIYISTQTPSPKSLFQHFMQTVFADLRKARPPLAFLCTLMNFVGYAWISSTLMNFVGYARIGRKASGKYQNSVSRREHC